MIVFLRTNTKQRIKTNLCMKKHLFSAMFALLVSFFLLPYSSSAQQGPSTYADGDSLARLVKMKYVYSFEEALRLSAETGKPIFFNAFADWARPCHAMNGRVFSDEAFCKWMDKHFVCLFVDVSKRENRHLADRYNIHSFAHYVVLNPQGQLIHRIANSYELPLFQEKVAAALRPASSLHGTTEAYRSGDHSKATLLAYLKALDDAGEDSLFKAVLPEYFSLLTSKDYVKKENWFIVSRKANEGTSSEMFRFIVSNRDKFDKSVGADEINTLLSKNYSNEIFQRMTSGQPYDEAAMIDTYMAMQAAKIPQTETCYTFYDIAKAYGTRDFHTLLAALPQLKDIQLRTIVEISLKFDELNPADHAAVLAYYREREGAYRAVGSSYARGYKEIADALETPSGAGTNGSAQTGIIFATGTYGEALAQAKAENKLVFVDCYTSWCGPCKMLARQTFPAQSVGEYMNPRFVSLQIDMEKGEGIELAKLWNVDAYPTMVILDAEGNVKGRVVGFYRPEQFLEEIKKLGF